MCVGAVPVTEGHYRSQVVPLLPRSTVYHCNGNEQTLRECAHVSTETTLDECITDDVGVVCQG